MVKYYNSFYSIFILKVEKNKIKFALWFLENLGEYDISKTLREKKWKTDLGFGFRTKKYFKIYFEFRRCTYLSTVKTLPSHWKRMTLFFLKISLSRNIIFQINLSLNWSHLGEKSRIHIYYIIYVYNILCQNFEFIKTCHNLQIFDISAIFCKHWNFGIFALCAQGHVQKAPIQRLQFLAFQML